MKNYKIKKKAIIIYGTTNKSGSLLAKHYTKKKFKVYGVLTAKKKDFSYLKKLNILDKVKIIKHKKNMKEKVKHLIKKSKCSKIFFFNEIITNNNNLLIEILECLRNKNFKYIKFFYFFYHSNFYDLAKDIDQEIIKAYRLQFNLKIYNMLLSNLGKKLLK